MNKKIWSNIFSSFLLSSLVVWHLFLLRKTFVVDALGNFRTANAGYGDIPLHLTQISRFAFGKISDLSDPIFYGAKLQYPFILNFISGLLLRFTHSWQFSVLFPVMILCVANIALLTIIYNKLLKNTLFAVLAVIVFFLGSGFGAYPVIKDAVVNRQSGQTLTQYFVKEDVSTISKWDATQNEQNIDYGAPLSLVFLHQRTFFLGFFGFLIVFLLLIKIKEKPKWQYALPAGIVYGLLPLWHTHSFIACSILIFIFLCFHLKNKEIRNQVVSVLLLGLIIALPQAYYLVSHKNLLTIGGDFVVLRLGWMVSPTIGSIQFGKTLPGIFNARFLEFLLLNFGIILPAFILAIGLMSLKYFKKFVPSEETRDLYFYIAVALAYFLIVQIIRFQPWDYDNNKILVYWQLFSVPVIFFVLAKIYEKRKIFGAFLTILIFVFSIFSGVLDQIPRTLADPQHLPIIFNTDARNMANYIKNNIGEKDLILTGETHLNLVDSLTGRPVLVGYPGWLWTRGINYLNREELIKDFYNNPTKESQIFKEYSIKYILLDDNSRYDFGASESELSKNFPVIYKVGNYILFKN